MDYSNVGNLLFNAPQLAVFFSGTGIAPPSGLIQTIFTAPFLFQGVFFDGNVNHTLVGQGIAGLTVNPFVNNGWFLQSATYTLDSVADPVPEPSTILLLGGGLAAMWKRTRRSVVLNPRAD
jgi:hypothetical protein